jgi:hypothetical protein
MSFIVEDTGESFERCPAGMHLGRCYRIIDLGTQKSEFKGEIKFQHKIMLGWEIHGAKDDGSKLLMADGRPFAIFKNYTLSWSEKANLRLDLQSWRGKAFTQEEMRRFDLSTVMGAWCMLNVIDKPSKTGNRVYSNVDGITPVPTLIKQAGYPQAVNKNEMFNLTDPDWAMFENFSDNLKKKIISSPEFGKAKGGAQPDSSNSAPSQFDDIDDQIPF